ncbi:type II secretion system protein N [Derxia gummosa]|uniref:Type II secretion system protein N n=1 Tax=Derxia gummosa DSM 723 TaxID=1121388 RepID=A0A8B6X8U7_9BURK|nr:type II secretion system protein N [Derxia gummosa]
MLTALFRGLTHLLAFSVLCAATAYWFVQLRAPMPPIVAVPAPPMQSVFDTGAQPRLFGGPVVTTALSNVQLVGVIAPREGERGGVAALVVDGRPVRAYRAGQSVAPGLLLAEVHANRVVFDQNGARAEVALARAPAADSGVPSGDGGGIARTISDPRVARGADGILTFENRPGPGGTFVAPPPQQFMQAPGSVAPQPMPPGAGEDAVIDDPSAGGIPPGQRGPAMRGGRARPNYSMPPGEDSN